MTTLHDRQIKYLALTVALISTAFLAWTVAYGQTKKKIDPSHKYFDIYFHKITILDSTGQKIKKDWKIGVNAHKKYTYITDTDTENIIVIADSLSTFYIFYNGKSYSFHLSDLKLFNQNNPEKTFYKEYEYNLYIQLPKKCTGGYFVFVKNTFWKNDQDGWQDQFGLTSSKITPCDNRVCFLGNINIKEKETRQYKRLKSEM